MSKLKINNWARLYEKLSKQNLTRMGDIRIRLKNKDGTTDNLELCFDDNGSIWYFVKENKVGNIY